jgi:NADH-quinone oxidoreductase subunit E
MIDLAKAEAALEPYRGDETSLITALQDVQDEYNWLPPEAIRLTGERLGVPLTRVLRVATFFKSFSLEPRGQHICQVCMGTACHVRGAPRVLEELERRLGVPAGRTTPDLRFTLETVNCLGACALGPIVVLDGEYHEAMTAAKVARLMKQVD